MPATIVCLHRLFVADDTIEVVRPHLERTEDRVWLSRTESCLRHTLRGVPAKLVDVCITEKSLAERVVLEICRKKGSYDGSERWTLTLRNWSHKQKTYMDSSSKPQPIYEGTFTVHAVPGAMVAVALWQGGSWTQAFACLRSDLKDYDLASIIMWHWKRYYQFLPFEEARALADTFEVSHPEVRSLTLAEANRLASRDLYRLARNLGWRKLTAKDRSKYVLDAQWVRQEVIAKRREEMGFSTTGCGQYTHEAAAGREMHEEEANGVIQTPYGKVEVE